MRLLSAFFVYFIKNIYHANTSFCNNTQYWCQQTSIGLKIYDPGYPALKENDYRRCLHYYNDNLKCKGFEYDENQGICRCVASLSQNVKDNMKTTMFWKTSTNVSCYQELSNGKSYTYWFTAWRN